MKSAAERQRDYRERRRQSGVVFISVELSPAAAAVVAALRDATGDSDRDIINGIILAYASESA